MCVLPDALASLLTPVHACCPRSPQICTYVVTGQLSHKDSMGTSESLGRGAVQFMSAGKGVVHSEHNLDVDSPVRFVQIW